MINASRVSEMFLNCLFKSEEVVDGKPTTEPVVVHGITINTGFHKERLESHRNEIISILAELPIQFQPVSKSCGGGGWSFLNMCMTKDDEQWTGLHKIMEELCLLSIGLNLAEFALTKDMWHAFPGGVPYFCIKG